MEVILSCKCGDTPAFSLDAYSLLFPDQPEPEMVVGEEKIRALADTVAPGSEAESYMRGIANSRDRFAIYLSIDDGGSIDKAYNLLTGSRIQ